MLSIDLAGLVSGSGIRGQFEEKFKALLKDIDEEGGNVICFIDELRAYNMLITFLIKTHSVTNITQIHY